MQLSMTPLIVKDIPKSLSKFLMFLTFVEGTDTTGEPYNEIIGFGKFNSFSKHPNRIVNKHGYYTSAAGRYSITNKTAQELNMPDFSPRNQDEAAIKLLKNCNAFEYILRSDWLQSIQQASKVWHSLPGSKRGHQLKSIKECLQFLDEN